MGVWDEVYCMVAVNLFTHEQARGGPDGQHVLTTTGELELRSLGTRTSEIAYQNLQKNKATPMMTAKPLTSTTGAVRVSKPARSGKTLGWGSGRAKVIRSIMTATNAKASRTCSKK